MKILKIQSASVSVGDVLTKHLSPYYIGGSIASTIYGIARAIMDIVIVADVKLHDSRE